MHWRNKKVYNTDDMLFRMAGNRNEKPFLDLTCPKIPPPFNIASLSKKVHLIVVKIECVWSTPKRLAISSCSIFGNRHSYAKVCWYLTLNLQNSPRKLHLLGVIYWCVNGIPHTRSKQVAAKTWIVKSISKIFKPIIGKLIYINMYFINYCFCFTYLSLFLGVSNFALIWLKQTIYGKT